MRNTETITIVGDNRDQGKAFLLTEMSAAAAERWATRAFFALMNTGVEIPEDIANAGMAGIASLGVQAFGKLPYEAAAPLLEDMWGCVQIIPDPTKPNVVRALIDEDIEEVSTRLQLRKAIFNLHTRFFTDAAP